MRRILACLLPSLVLCLLVPAAYAGNKSCNDAFVPVMGSAMSGIRDAQNLVITTESEWCAFWNEVHSILYPAPACDLMGIDFQFEAAIVVALGGRPNSCHGVHFYCVHKGKGTDNRVAYYRVLSPDEACMCLQVVTHPFHVVKVEKPVGRVNFVGEAAIFSCE